MRSNPSSAYAGMPIQNVEKRPVAGAAGPLENLFKIPNGLVRVDQQDEMKFRHRSPLVQRYRITETAKGNQSGFVMSCTSGKCAYLLFGHQQIGTSAPPRGRALVR